MTEHLQSQIDAIRALMDVGCSFQEAVAGLNCEPGPWELSLGAKVNEKNSIVI